MGVDELAFCPSSLRVAMEGRDLFVAVLGRSVLWQCVLCELGLVDCVALSVEEGDGGV